MTVHYTFPTEEPCPECRRSFDWSAITDCYLITEGRNGRPLVRFGTGTQPGMHVHDAVLCDRYLLSWRGFFAYKTRPYRYQVTSRASRLRRTLRRLLSRKA